MDKNMSVQETAHEVGRQTPPSGNGSGSQPDPAENVERIREILFGPQIREYGQRLTRIEERLAQETAELKAEVRRRLDWLEAFTRQEVNDLGERLRTERGERMESANRISQSFADSVKSLEKCSIESDDRMSNGLRELRQLTLDRIKGVLDELTAQISAMDGFQNRHMDELRSRSVDKYAFSCLLTELALRVQGELGITRLGESDGGPKP